MHVGLGVIRDVVVDHVSNAVDVEAAGSNVGSHQDVQAAILELIDGTLTLLLRDIAVNGSGVVAGLFEAVGHVFGRMLRAAEDDDGVVVNDLEDASEGIHLVAVRR